MPHQRLELALTPSEIVCRLCGKDYGQADGCDICAPAKRAIVWPAMADSEPPLLQQAQRAVKLINLNLARLEKEMVDSVGGRAGQFYAPHAKEAAMLGRSLAFVLAEARKLEERDEKRVQNMSFDERKELFLEFVRSLPMEHQRDICTRAVGLLEAGDPAVLDD